VDEETTMDKILPLIFLLACPLMMIFMMKGMHGGHGGHDQHGDPQHHDDRDRRIAELEHQVAELQEQRTAPDGEARAGRARQ
jgi:hypothetical protein